MLSNLREFILDNEFRISIYKNKINILNYSEIDHFDDSKIIVRFSDGTVIIKGNNLIISKLLDDELLISGNVISLEFKWLID